MNLPDNFKWIETIGVLPKMVSEGIKILGTKEIAGPANNPVIMALAAELGVGGIYTSDDKQAWCAIAHCGIARRSEKVVTFPDKYDFLRALAFAKQAKLNPRHWILVPNKDAMFGDSLVFKREEGGHVGMYIGESATHYYVMGGNQNNMYSFTRVAKDRLVAVIRPVYISVPASVKKYFLTDTGVPATTNEK